MERKGSQSFWETYYKIPPGAFRAAARDIKVVGMVVDADNREQEHLSPKAYQDAAAALSEWLKINKWVTKSYPEEEWEPVGEEIKQWAEIRDSGDKKAAKAYWDAHPLLEKYYGSGAKANAGVTVGRSGSVAKASSTVPLLGDGTRTTQVTTGATTGPKGDKTTILPQGYPATTRGGADWQEAFAQVHGRAPTDVDYQDMLWSQKFASMSGRPPNRGEWQWHYFNSRQAGKIPYSPIPEFAPGFGGRPAAAPGPTTDKPEPNWMAKSGVSAEDWLKYSAAMGGGPPVSQETPYAMQPQDWATYNKMQPGQTGWEQFVQEAGPAADALEAMHTRGEPLAPEDEIILRRLYREHSDEASTFEEWLKGYLVRLWAASK